MNRVRYWCRHGMDQELAHRWAQAEQHMRMRLSLLLGDDIAMKLRMIVTPSGALDFDYDELI